LSYNYRLLGTWPLALTAYNHGAAGMRRAKDAMGTDDIERIVRGYRSPSFGFASRNFYVSFLAALEIDRHPDKYFGNVEPLAELRFIEIATPSYVPINSLERILKIDRSSLRTLNPALLPAVWNSQRHVPKGYHLRLPADGEKWTTELLAQRLTPTEQYAGQPQDRRHRVRAGETLSGIAATYGVTAQALGQLNGLRSSAKVRVGRSLLVPASPAVTVVAAAAAPQPAPAAVAAAAAAAEGEAANVYLVRRGDSISEISKKVGLSEGHILKINKLRNRNYIYEGQKLALAAPGEAVPSQPPVAAVAALPTRPAMPTPAPAVTPPAKPVVVASAAPGGVPADEAQRESAEDAQAVANVGRPAARAEPVSAAQAEALGRAWPAVEAPVGRPSLLRPGGRHHCRGRERKRWYYADIASPFRLQVNDMKFSRPVIVAQLTRLTSESKTSEQTRINSPHAARQLARATAFSARRSTSSAAATRSGPSPSAMPACPCGCSSSTTPTSTLERCAPAPSSCCRRSRRCRLQWASGCAGDSAFLAPTSERAPRTSSARKSPHLLPCTYPAPRPLSE
jgi:LysM repeat protein